MESQDQAHSEGHRGSDDEKEVKAQKEEESQKAQPTDGGEAAEKKEEDNDQEKKKEGEEEEKEVNPMDLLPNRIFTSRTSIILSRSHDDSSPEDECSYCNGKRTVDDPETGEKGIQETDCKYFKLGFSATKLTVNDMDHFFNCGFTRCGSYIYKRNSKDSCCEIFQYRVDVTQFKMSDSQKKVIRRFHKYLNYGDIHYKKEGQEKEEQKKEAKAEVPEALSVHFKSLLEEVFKESYLSQVLAEKRIDEETSAKTLASIQKKHKITINGKRGCFSSNLFFAARAKPFDFVAEFGADEIQKTFKELIETKIETCMKNDEIRKEIKDLELETLPDGKGIYINIVSHTQLKQARPPSAKQSKQPKKPKKSKQSKLLEAPEEKQIEGNPAASTDKEMKDEESKQPSFSDYLKAHIPYKPVENPKHVYTFELRTPLFNEELFDLYLRYEKAVHKKDRERDDIKRFFCSSPLYDPENPRDEHLAKRMAPYNFETIDDGKENKDHGLYPGLGSYHFYHRIDGKLVAVGNVDLTKSLLNSQYLIYDPDYSFLCLGVVSAVHELEYSAMIREKFNPRLQYYQLGEIVLDCPKVNYKMNYKPGLLICPRTNVIVNFDNVKDKIRSFTKLPQKYKKEKMKFMQLFEGIGEGEMTEFEFFARAIKDQAENIKFLYENKRILPIECLQQGGKDHIIPLSLQMIQHLGLECFQQLMLELKFQPKTEEQKKKEEEQRKEKEAKKEEEEKAKQANQDGPANEDKQDENANEGKQAEATEAKAEKKDDGGANVDGGEGPSEEPSPSGGKGPE